MVSIKELEREIIKIKERNKKVEADKAWETSWTRKILVFILTYIAVVIFFIFADLPDPFINSIVPALAFVISTAALPMFKKAWLKNLKR